ncbi:MAG: 2-oxo acid dehydrogenase subunit E2 [Anaerolineales bacterium]|nr:2-oxo acid dehydrogenase subunit E2 [Anaerolineales bacterium]
MAEEVYIPKFGQTVEEVTIVEWLVEDGSSVKVGDELLRVETDKAIFSVEANRSGYLHKGPYQPGDVLPVLSVVATIGEQDEQFLVPQSVLQTNLEPQSIEVKSETVHAVEQTKDEQKKIFISPRARRLLRQKNVPLDNVVPTGGGGKRIIEQDVIAALKQMPKLTPLARRIAEAEGVELDSLDSGERWVTKEDIIQIRDKKRDGTAVPQESTEGEPFERVPIQGIRKVIFEHMAESVHSTARVTLTTEADATELVALRNRLKERYSDNWGFSPTYLDLIGKIVVSALRKYPYMNARLERDVLEIYHTVNLGIAVDTNRGLIVPVVKNAEKLSLRRFGETMRQLASAAREGNISPDHLRDGTFTITNLGKYEIDVFTPVINTPEIAILGLGRIVDRVVPYKGQIVIRPMMILSLVFDHRLADGAPAAKFLQEIKHLIEDPTLWLVESLGE